MIDESDLFSAFDTSPLCEHVNTWLHLAQMKLLLGVCASSRQVVYYERSFN